MGRALGSTQRDLLGLLATGDRSSFELLGLPVSVSISRRQSLRRLEDQMLVTRQKTDDGLLWSITPTGRDALQEAGHG